MNATRIQFVCYSPQPLAHMEAIDRLVMVKFGNLRGIFKRGISARTLANLMDVSLAKLEASLARLAEAGYVAQNAYGDWRKA